MHVGPAGESGWSSAASHSSLCRPCCSSTCQRACQHGRCLPLHGFGWLQQPLQTSGRHRACSENTAQRYPAGARCVQPSKTKSKSEYDDSLQKTGSEGNFFRL